MSTLGRLRNKVSIVTGASSGLGRAISLAYAKQGSQVVCADLSPRAREQIPGERESNTVELIRKNGGQATFVQTDVSVSKQMEDLVKRAVSEFGRLDIMVNNAGVSMESRNSPAAIHETTESIWDITMAVNVKSVFLGCKYATAQMLKQEPDSSGERGSLINLSSIFGLVGGRFNPSYAASKGAVLNLTRNIALDYAESRIRCNAICPGYTETAIFVDTTKNFDDYEGIKVRHPLKGIGKASDIVGAAVFLASEEAGWVTGVGMPVDGGYTAQ